MYDFREHGYTVVPQVISKELCDIVTQYVFFDELQRPITTDMQVPNAPSRYADPLMETVLLMIKKEVERASGLSLLPTYSYYRLYGKGDELVKHTDREACEISTTLCFNNNYGNDYDWCIYMNGSPISLNPGDMAVYRGIDIEHWREPFDFNDDNAYHLQGFFHYVDVDGDFPNWKYDGRQSIGLPSRDVFANRLRPLHIK